MNDEDELHHQERCLGEIEDIIRETKERLFIYEAQATHTRHLIRLFRKRITKDYLNHYSKYDRTIASFLKNFRSIHQNLIRRSNMIQRTIATTYRENPLLHEIECEEAFNLELDTHYFLETLNGIPPDPYEYLE